MLYRRAGAAALLVALLWVVLGVAGCSITKEIVASDYQKSAALNYDAGVAEFMDKDYDSAKFYFDIVIRKYPVSKYAALAQLRMADILFATDDYISASQAYARFVKEHATHDCARYAVYMEGVAYLMQVPEDWWFLPPAYERDQQMTEQAYDTLRRFLIMEHALTPEENAKHLALGEVDEERALADPQVGFCNGPNPEMDKAMVSDAYLRLNWCVQRLLARELYVARFYLKRDKPMGAIMRLESVLENKRFKERGIADSPSVLYLLLEAYSKTEKPQDGCKYYFELRKVLKEAESSEMMSRFALLCATASGQPKQK